MKVRVEKHTQQPLPVDIVKISNDLLEVIPSEDLVGLEAILLVDSINIKSEKKGAAEGIYRVKRRGSPAYIEIAIVERANLIPRVLYHSSYYWSYRLAVVIYHEVGHHRMQYSHGIREQDWEDFAERYMRQMLRRAFPLTSLAVRLVCSPLKLIRKGVGQG